LKIYEGMNMKIQLKSLAPVALGMALAVAGPSAFAKGHDQGVADGTPLDDTGLFSRNGAIAGVNVPGIGAAGFAELGLCREGFCGVVGDPGQTYGRDIVSVQRALDLRRVYPVVGNGINSRDGREE
jgi:hypothetical protein